MESDPQRPSPNVEYTLANGDQAILNYTNTDVYMYDNPYQQVNHVYYHPEENSGGYIFGDEMLLRRLIKKRFPHHRYPWPDQHDTDVYVACETQDLDDDLNRLLGGEQ